MQTILMVTATGRVTLTKEVLDQLGLVPGDKIALNLLPSGRAEVRAAKPGGSIEAFFGCLAQPGTKSFTIEEINEAIADGWAGIR